MGFFKVLSTLPEDPIFSLTGLYAKNQHANKVNLGIGVYRDGEGMSTPFSCIKKAEQALLEKDLGKDYLPIDGDPLFLKSLLAVIFGYQSNHSIDPNIYAAQSVGGTGALRIGAELVSREFSRIVFIPEITWSNHFQIFQAAGMRVHTYPYSINEKGELDFEKLCKSIEKIPPGSLILLHACCHNPTGVDFTLEQWKLLSALIEKGKLLPFFDFAYHGLGVDLDKDAAGIRYFHAQGHEMMVAYSCSKNFGLYGERVGMLAIVTHDPETANVASHVKSLIRTNFSNSPLHGSRLVALVLQSPALTAEWQKEVQAMRERCYAMRLKLKLGLANTKKDFSFLLNQKGLFSLTGLTRAEVLQLRENYGVIMPDNGRLNIAALTERNVAYVSQAISDIVNG